MTDHTGVRLWVGPHRSVVLGVLGLMTSIAFESYAVTTVLPVVAKELAGVQWYSLAYASTLVTSLIGMTIGGNWADRRGIDVPLAVGGSLFLAGIAICVLAPTMEVFVAGRLLQGIGGGIDSVILYVVIAQFIPKDIRARMFGLITTAWLLPGIAGPLLTGVLVEIIGWRSVFALILVGAGASLSSLLFIVRGSRHPSTERPIFGRRGWWAVVAATGVLSLHYSGQQPAAVLAVGTALGLLATTLAAVKLLPRGTLGFRAGVPRLIGLRGLLGAATAATELYLPLYLQRELRYTPIESGFVVAVGAFGWVAGAWLQGRSDGGPPVLRRATALVLCGPVGVMLFVAESAPTFVPIIGCVLMGTGMGLAFPQLTAAVLARSMVGEQGINSSALQMSQSLTTSALIAVTGAILSIATANQYLTAYSVVAGIAVLAVAVSMRQTTDLDQKVTRGRGRRGSP